MTVLHKVELWSPLNMMLDFWGAAIKRFKGLTKPSSGHVVYKVYTL